MMILSFNLFLSLLTFVNFTTASYATREKENTTFYQNYYVTWGYDHALLLKQEREIQLSLDQNSGAAFESKWKYGSGLFHMRMKIPDKNSIGVVTAFNLTSHSTNHDEIDFEFLGNDGPPYALQTNVYTNGHGGREQRIHLWFDPTKDLHSYKILWNQYQIVLFVDHVPIRVFKNNTKMGVNYPAQPMQIEGSIWNAEGWASSGKKIDWNQAPFQAHFEGFDVEACSLQDIDTRPCSSLDFWWNKKYEKLNSNQQRSYESVRNKYLYYDYCSDRSRYPQEPPECQSNQ